MVPSDASWQVVVEDRRKLFLGRDAAAKLKGTSCTAPHRSVTVVTLMTLIFTPMLKGHHWDNVLTGKTTETTSCNASPATRARHGSTVTKIVQPQP